MTLVQRAPGFVGDSGVYGQGCTCGATADDRTTVNRYHLAGCGYALSCDDQAAYATAGVYAAVAQAPLEGAHGRVRQDDATGRP